MPAVAHAELSVYFTGTKGKSQEEVDFMLRTMGIEVEWFRHLESCRTAEIAVQRGDFSLKSRDYMIAAHAYLPPWVIATYNVKDFDFLANRVKTPTELMRGH